MRTIQSIILLIEIIIDDTYQTFTHASHCIKLFNHHNCPVSAVIILILQMRKPTQREVKQFLSGINQTSGKDDISDLKQIYEQSRRQSQERFKNRGQSTGRLCCYNNGQVCQKGQSPGCEAPERLVISNPALWICTTNYLGGEFYDEIVFRAVSFCPVLSFCILIINLYEIFS